MADDTTQDAPAAKTAPRKFQRDTSWEDLTTAVLPNGAKATKFAIAADQDDVTAPAGDEGLHVDVLLQNLS